MGEDHVPGVEPELGLRERKKRETRRRIADIATGLFMTRGFDNVTIADVARTADVSVNTVFNYFRTKEDLFFDRQDEVIEAAGRDFRDRRPGEGAVALFRRRFFEGLDARGHQTAFHEGSEVWTRTVRDSPALMARQREIGRRAQDRLADLLAEATGAGPDDIAPRAAAAMIFAVQNTLVEQIADRKSAGRPCRRWPRTSTPPRPAPSTCSNTASAATPPPPRPAPPAPPPKARWPEIECRPTADHS